MAIGSIGGSPSTAFSIVGSTGCSSLEVPAKPDGGVMPTEGDWATGVTRDTKTMSESGEGAESGGGG